MATYASPTAMNRMGPPTDRGIPQYRGQFQDEAPARQQQQSIWDTHQDAMGERQMGLDALLQQYNAIQNDERMRAAQQHYQNVLSGRAVPFTQGVQGAMIGQAGDAAAAAERAQQGMLQRGLAASGGSIYDPSYQAQQGQLLANRQLQTQGAARDIKMQAALANFQAQQQAAGALHSSAAQQQSLASPLAAAQAQARLNTTFTAPNTGPVHSTRTLT